MGVCWHRAIPILFFYLAAYFRNKIGGFLSPKNGPRPKDFVSGWLAWVTPCIFVSRFGQSVAESCSEIVIVQIWKEAQHWNWGTGALARFCLFWASVWSSSVWVLYLEAVQHDKCSSLFKPVDSPRGTVKVHFYSLNYLLFISASVRTETNQNYRSSKLRWLDLNPQTLSVKRSQ